MKTVWHSACHNKGNAREVLYICTYVAVQDKIMLACSTNGKSLMFAWIRKNFQDDHPFGIIILGLQTSTRLDNMLSFSLQRFILTKWRSHFAGCALASAGFVFCFALVTPKQTRKQTQLGINCHELCRMPSRSPSSRPSLPGHQEAGRDRVPGRQATGRPHTHGDVRGLPEENRSHHRRLHPQPSPSGPDRSGGPGGGGFIAVAAGDQHDALLRCVRRGLRRCDHRSHSKTLRLDGEPHCAIIVEFRRRSTNALLHLYTNKLHFREVFCSPRKCNNV